MGINYSTLPEVTLPLARMQVVSLPMARFSHDGGGKPGVLNYYLSTERRVHLMTEGGKKIMISK